MAKRKRLTYCDARQAAWVKFSNTYRESTPLVELAIVEIAFITAWNACNEYRKRETKRKAGATK